MQLATPETPLAARRRWLPALIVAALAALAVLAPAARAAAVDDGAYGIRPAAEADFFHLELAPGAALEAEAIATNYTASPVTLQAYPVDATSHANGFAMEDADAPRDDIGAWVRLADDEVVVPANSEVRVPFTVTVPAGTTPGDYAGALIVQAPAEEGETTELEDGTSVRLDVVQRLGVRIYLNVSGEALPGLETGALTWERDGEALTFQLPVTNTGNTNLDPVVELATEGWPGGRRTVAFETSEELLTGSTHVLEARIEDMPAFYFGSAEASVSSDAGDAAVDRSVVYVEPPLAIGACVVLAVIVLIGWRWLVFVRRARSAIAEVEQLRGGATSA